MKKSIIVRAFFDAPRDYSPRPDAATSRALFDAIRAAEGRATARTITPEEVVSALYMITEKLGFLPRKYMEGVAVDIDYHAQDFPHAYKYTPESTHFCAVYKRGSWRVIDIYRATTRRASQAYRVDLTDAAKEAIIAHYSTMPGIGF